MAKRAAKPDDRHPSRKGAAAKSAEAMSPGRDSEVADGRTENHAPRPWHVIQFVFRGSELSLFGNMPGNDIGDVKRELPRINAVTTAYAKTLAKAIGKSQKAIRPMLEFGEGEAIVRLYVQDISPDLDTTGRVDKVFQEIARTGGRLAAGDFPGSSQAQEGDPDGTTPLEMGSDPSLTREFTAVLHQFADTGLAPDSKLTLSRVDDDPDAAPYAGTTVISSASAVAHPFRSHRPKPESIRIEATVSEVKPNAPKCELQLLSGGRREVATFVDDELLRGQLEITQSAGAVLALKVSEFDDGGQTPPKGAPRFVIREVLGLVGEDSFARVRARRKAAGSLLGMPDQSKLSTDARHRQQDLPWDDTRPH